MSTEPELRRRLRLAEERLHRLENERPAPPANVRDLSDVKANKASTAQTLVYDFPSGQYRSGSLAVFSYAGSVAAGASGRWYPGRSRSQTVRISRTAGTTALTVTLYKNGVSIGLVGTTATGTTAAAFFGAVFADEDYLTVNATTPGTGTTDLVVQVGFG